MINHRFTALNLQENGTKWHTTQRASLPRPCRTVVAPVPHAPVPVRLPWQRYRHGRGTGTVACGVGATTIWHSRARRPAHQPGEPRKAVKYY